LRYLSVRHYFPHVKTCIQIILPQSKQQIMLNLSSHHRRLATKRVVDSSSIISIPSTLYHQEDDASNYLMCLNELKMGLMSRSCIAPGFSTLVTNLLKSHFARDFSFGFDSPVSLLSSPHLSWLHNYRKFTCRLLWSDNLNIITIRNGVFAVDLWNESATSFSPEILWFCGVGT